MYSLNRTHTLVDLKTNWASHVKSVLETHGFNHIWQEQLNMRIPFELIKQRITDMFLQKWYSEINNSPRLQSYCFFKHNYNTEIYVSCIKESKYRIALARFRTSSHNLSIEKDRHIHLTKTNDYVNHAICKP